MQPVGCPGIFFLAPSSILHLIDVSIGMPGAYQASLGASDPAFEDIDSQREAITVAAAGISTHVSLALGGFVLPVIRCYLSSFVGVCSFFGNSY